MAKSIKEDKSEGTTQVYTVVSSFRDKDNFNRQYHEGDDVSHFDKERIESLLKSGLIKEGK